LAKPKTLIIDKYASMKGLPLVDIAAKNDENKIFFPSDSKTKPMLHQ
jgi:hypothetical protein